MAQAMIAASLLSFAVAPPLPELRPSGQRYELRCQFAFQAGLWPFKPGRFSRLLKFDPVEFAGLASLMHLLPAILYASDRPTWLLGSSVILTPSVPGC